MNEHIITHACTPDMLWLETSNYKPNKYTNKLDYLPAYICTVLMFY